MTYSIGTPVKVKIETKGGELLFKHGVIAGHITDAPFHKRQPPRVQYYITGKDLTPGWHPAAEVALLTLEDFKGEVA